MKCEEARDEMIAYLRGELDEARKNEIDEHLARCQGCRRELESAQKILHKAQAANEASVISLTDEIISNAVTAGASDIHLDPTRDGADILYRIDGVLHSVRHLSLPERDAVLARIRQMAGLPLTEVRTLQDGRLDARVGDREFDLRLATMPVLLGEKAVLRIFDRGVPLLGLEKMNFSEEQMETVQRLLRQPNGMVVTTGPAGSGKTTLLYSMVMQVARPEMSVVTIEDPIEWQLPGVQQAQVSPRNDFTFATALRGYLRQDPDVIMVGEMRDFETLAVASQAVLTGHLVLGQLLMESAVDVPQNMVAFGVDPWVAGRVLSGVIACRLARKVCQECREEYTPSPEVLEFLGFQHVAGKIAFYRGRGCDKCCDTGYRGRVQLHEILVIGRELSKMICRGETDPDVLFRQAVQDGFKPMVEDGRRFILEGVTSPDEVYRILSWR